jgi:hypothetical protein
MKNTIFIGIKHVGIGEGWFFLSFRHTLKSPVATQLSITRLDFIIYPLSPSYTNFYLRTGG